jgi:hypothetical protein
MTKTVRAVLEEPTMLRLEEPVELPLHVPVEVTIREPLAGSSPAVSFLDVAETLQFDGPSDFSERWEEYLRVDEHDRNK